MSKRKQKSIVNFWYEEGKKLKISYVDHVESLTDLGFFRFKLELATQYVLLKDNTLKVVKTDEMKHRLKHHIKEEIPQSMLDPFPKKALLEVLQRSSKNLYSYGNLENLEQFSDSILKDTKDTCYLPFNNCYVKITKTGFETGKYKDLPFPVWNTQIINRDFKKLRSKTKTSEWEQVISDVCKDDEKRIKSLMTVIGYLLHTYKNPSLCPVIIFLDEQIGDFDEAHGGTGKSLILSVLKHFRDVLTIDGKGFKPDYNHAWQSVKPSTQVIVLDDVDRYFNFEKLYSISTGDMPVNPKGKDEYILPFKESPKISMTTNFAIRGTGGYTEERRKFEVEFSETYGPKQNPRKKFGHNLFYDWDEKEWNRCNNFIIECIQLFLSEGLIKSPVINRKLRNLIGSTNADFVLFMDHLLEQGVKRFHKQDTKEEFVKDNPDFGRFKNGLTQNRFTKWVKAYLKYKKLEFIETPTAQRTYIEIISDNDDGGSGKGNNNNTNPVSPIENSSKKKYKVIQTKKDRTALIKDLVEQDEVCFDVETTSKNAMEAELVGMAFSTKTNEGFYVPIPADEQEAAIIVKEFTPIFNNEKIELIGHNIKYDLTVMKRYNTTVSCSIFDTMLARYLCSPDTPLTELGLKYLTKKHLGVIQTSFEDVVGKGKDEKPLRNIPVDVVGEYACQDVDYTLQLKHIFEQELVTKGVVDVFYEIDAPLILVLTELDVNGVNVDLNVLNKLDEEFNAERMKHKSEINKVAGKELNINSSDQLKGLLIDELGLQHPGDKTSKGVLSMAKGVLKKMEGEHDVVKLITSCKEVGKLMNDFTQKLPEMVNERTGRLHAVMQNTTTGTGRLSCTNPNFQGFPKRDPQGRKIREAIIPSPNNILLAADLSQIQLRLIAHQSGDEKMVALFKKNADIHRSTAAKVFGVTESKVTDEQRSLAKAVNFGLCFGITEHGLHKNTGVSKAEAREFIDKYFEEFPGVKKYMDDAIFAVHEKGYSTTIKGRKRDIKNINSYGFTRKKAENKAINSPIQGSEADYMKIAMLNIHNVIKKEKLNTKMILCVHDELVFDVPKNEKRKVLKIVEHEMEHAIKLKVPVKVDTNFGNNWLEAH